MQHYMITFVSDLQQVGGFLRFSSTNKNDCHDIIEILLKVALNTIKPTNQNILCGEGMPVSIDVSLMEL